MSTIGIDFGTSNTRIVVQERNHPEATVEVPSHPLLSVAHQSDGRWAQGLSGAPGLASFHPKDPLSKEALAPDHWVNANSGPVPKTANVSGEIVPYIEQSPTWRVGSDGGPALTAARGAATAILKALRHEFDAVIGRLPEEQDEFVLGCPAGQTLGRYRMTLVAAAPI